MDIVLSNTTSKFLVRNGNTVDLEREGASKLSKILACANRNGFSLVIIK